MVLNGAPRAYLGIDIGTVTIKMVELLARGKRCELTTYAYASIPERRPWRPAGIFDETSAAVVADVIKRMLDKAQSSSDMAVFSLPTGHLFSQVIKVPRMLDEQLWSAALFKAQASLPLSVGEVVMAVTKPGEVKQYFKTPDKMKGDQSLPGEQPENISDNDGLVSVLLTAVPRNVLAWYALVAKMAGLTLLAAESEVFPLLRMYGVKEKSPVLFCSVGWGETSFYLVTQNIIQFSRTIDFGYRDRQEEANYEPLAKVAQSILNQSEGNKRGIARVVLCGGGVDEPRVGRTLTQYFGTIVTTSNPWRGLAYPQGLEEKISKLAPLFSVAVGLARRDIEEV